MIFEVLSCEELTGIPSASGIVKAGEEYFVVGDDSPFLFCLDKNFKQTGVTRIYSADKVEGERIAKKHKPDFEAMEMVNDNEFAIFGSGSKSPERDYFVRVLTGQPFEVKTHLITKFYTHLKNLEILKGTELNIEAAAEYKGTFFLFNRKKNLVISFNYSDFIDHVENDSPIPEISVTEVKLPGRNGIEAGFSGATAFPHKPILIFTASVEDTDNAYDDGEILGSFIGLLDIETNKLIDEVIFISTPADKDPFKIESVAIDKEISETEVDLILTTDSDGGISEILRGKLRL